MTRFHRLIVSFSITVSMLTFGCRTAMMSVPPDLAAAAEPYSVSGTNPRIWNRPVGFGPWKTTKVREGLRWGFTAPLFGLEAGFSRQAYRFVLKHESGMLVQAECVTRNLFLESNWTIDPSFGTLPSLACGFRAAETDDEWTLRLYSRGTGLSGLIDSGDRQWTLRSVHTLEGGSFQNADPVGYELLHESSTVGAVEIVNRGRVWIAPALGEGSEARAAAAAVALLLYDPPSD